MRGAALLPHPTSRRRAMSTATQAAPFRVLVIPIFRHYWLHYGCNAAAEAMHAGGPAAAIDWRTGRGLEEKASLWLTATQNNINARLLKQWRELQNARQGTLKNWVYRFAQSVLAREEPEESFLKTVPSQLRGVEVIYPSSLDVRLVRRNLRHLVRDRLARHRRRLVYWSMATIPLLPLVATPLPNIPVYYAGYRVYSHYRALEGAKQLQTAFAQQDAQQLGALRDSLMVMQEVQGMQFPADSWPAHLLRTEKRYLDILEDWRSRAREFYGGPSPDALVPTFTASKELDRLVDPMVRLEHPLSDEAVSHITKQFDAPQLLELVARARRRVTGSSFPRDDF